MLELKAIRAEPEREDRHATPQALFVVPTRSGDGFRASIRGHQLDLADPDSPAGLAPTPDDLLLVSVASEIAWSARRFLRSWGLDAHVNVSARECPASRCPDVIVSVADGPVEIVERLATALEDGLPARLRGLVSLGVSLG